MSTDITSDNGTPIARREFAKRLRELRVPRGFRTARSLARALNIDENRYTRYERAEVEPDLTMIRRICEILDITPDDLLYCRRAEHTEPTPSETHAMNGNDRPSARTAPGASDLQTCAWMLAEAATDVRCRHAALVTSHDGTPLASVAATCRLYQALMDRPFESIAELLAHADVEKVDLPTANILRQSIDQFVSVVKSRG